MMIAIAICGIFSTIIFMAMILAHAFGPSNIKGIVISAAAVIINIILLNVVGALKAKKGEKK